jgi:hypothetical protein
MKILRRHVGFTTNSSASSEWADLSAMYQAMADNGGTGTDGETAAAPADGSTGGAAPDIGKVEVSPTPVAPKPPMMLWDNLSVIGGLLLTIVGFFAAERLIRRRLRKRRAQQDDDDV